MGVRSAAIRFILFITIDAAGVAVAIVVVVVIVVAIKNPENQRQCKRIRAFELTNSVQQFGDADGGACERINFFVVLFRSVVVELLSYHT